MSPPNITLERSAGSHTLAAAAQRDRSAARATLMVSGDRVRL